MTNFMLLKDVKIKWKYTITKKIILANSFIQNFRGLANLLFGSMYTSSSIAFVLF